MLIQNWIEQKLGFSDKTKSPSRWVIFCNFLENKAILIRGVAKNGGTQGGISWWHPLSTKILVKTKKKVFAAKRVGFQYESM